MATKVDKFVTEASAELADIRTDFEAVALKAQVLANKWNALNKTNMEGWASYNWAGLQFTSAELAGALNKLDNVNSMSLVDLSAALSTLRKIV